MLRVAITRAQPEADRTAERVRARGAEAIVAPLLTIVPCGYDTSTSGAQAIIFTSTNGVRAFPDARPLCGGDTCFSWLCNGSARDERPCQW